MQPYVHKENTALLCFPLTVTKMSCKTATTQDIYLHHDGLGEGLKRIYSTTCLKNCIAANTAVTYRIPGKIMVEGLVPNKKSG
jgi:hypothetical protein